MSMNGSLVRGQIRTCKERKEMVEGGRIYGYSHTAMKSNKKRLRIWCLRCDTKEVEPGKKCKACGARCLIAPDRKRRKQLLRIRLEELTLDDLAELEISCQF